MVVKIGEVVHEAAASAEAPSPAATAPSAGADMPSPAEFRVQVIAAIAREASRRGRLWAD